MVRRTITKSRETRPPSSFLLSGAVCECVRPSCQDTASFGEQEDEHTGREQQRRPDGNREHASAALIDGKHGFAVLETDRLQVNDSPLQEGRAFSNAPGSGQPQNDVRSCRRLRGGDTRVPPPFKVEPDRFARVKTWAAEAVSGPDTGPHQPILSRLKQSAWK